MQLRWLDARHNVTLIPPGATNSRLYVRHHPVEADAEQDATTREIGGRGWDLAWPPTRLLHRARHIQASASHPPLRGSEMPLLLSVSRKPGEWPGTDRESAFPFSVPAIRTLPELALDAPVTFLVGENGTGKSTLLEALATAAQLPTLGGSEAIADDSLTTQRELGDALRLAWRKRTRKGFYLRAEDFFGYLRRMARDDARLARERRELGLTTPPPTRADDWRSGVHVDEAAAGAHLARYDARSHGESFIDVFQQRVRGEGLYLLDEPEAPLSPQRQIALLSLVWAAARAGAQFIIATHSPILLALPGARIYSFDHPPVHEVRYNELENVALTRDFLNAPERFLRHLA